LTASGPAHPGFQIRLGPLWASLLAAARAYTPSRSAIFSRHARALFKPRRMLHQCECRGRLPDRPAYWVLRICPNIRPLTVLRLPPSRRLATACGASLNSALRTLVHCQQRPAPHVEAVVADSGIRQRLGDPSAERWPGVHADTWRAPLVFNTAVRLFKSARRAPFDGRVTGGVSAALGALWS
jgi:hypothetical protein